MQTLGTLIRSLRTRSRFRRLTDFAARVGVSERALNYFENDEKTPRPDVLAAIAITALATPAERQALDELRANAVAARAGCAVAPTMALDIPGLANDLAVDAIMFLRRRGRAVSADDRGPLTACLSERLSAAIDPAPVPKADPQNGGRNPAVQAPKEPEGARTSVDELGGPKGNPVTIVGHGDRFPNRVAPIPLSLRMGGKR